MKVGRRRVLALLGSSPLLGVPVPARAGESGGRLAYLSTNAASGETYRVAGMTTDGRKVFEVLLPGRGHAIAVNRGRCEAIAFARRPGLFAIVLDLRSGRGHARLRLPAGRHFYGHGVYSADGALLYTTENDFEAGRGVIGVWDAGDGYRRVREIPSHGIGPHELALAGDGRTLIVANGGILTHPDSGRRKLNIPTMNPSLAYIDVGDGRLLESVGFDGARHRLLSIRHIAVNAEGEVCIALQDEGDRGNPMPLIAFHRRGAPALDLRALPHSIVRRMRGYTGSAVMDSSGGFAAVSAPRGGLITLWDVEQRALTNVVQLRDGCGVAPTGSPGLFLATSGEGSAIRIDALNGEAKAVQHPFILARRWDNHLIRVAMRP